MLKNTGIQAFLFVVFILISVPFHELSHLVVLKMFGAKAKVSTSLFHANFNQYKLTLGGFVKPVDGSNNYQLPISPANKVFKLICAILLLSGGFGSALIFYLIYLYVPIGYKYLWGGPIIVVVIFQLLKGVEEVVVGLNNNVIQS